MAGPFLGHFERVLAIAATPRLLAVGGARARGNSAITIYDHVGNKPKGAFVVETAIHALAVVKRGDAHHFCGGGEDGIVYVVDDDGKAVGHVKLDAGITALAAGDGGEVLVGTKAGTVHVLTFQTSWTKTSTATLSQRRIRAVASGVVGKQKVVAAAGDDGVIRIVAADLSGEAKELAGHEGAVNALAFMPRDGRLASGADDGTIKLWYLTGAPDCETRGADSSGHAGGVTGLVYVSSGDPAVDGSTQDRLYSSGRDGNVRAWRLEDKKKPRTDEVGDAIAAFCVVPKQKAGGGQLFFAGESRKVRKKSFETPNDWESGHPLLDDGFARIKDTFSGAAAKRNEAIGELAALDDDEALALLEDRLVHDKEAATRLLVVQGLAKRPPQGAPARTARRVLKNAVNDADAGVRAAAFDALDAVSAVGDADDAYAAPKAALSSSHSDLRVRALRELAKRGQKNPGLVLGAITKKLVDSDAVVAATALEALLELAKAPEQKAEALRTALLRGNATVRLDALVRAALLGMQKDASISDLFARAFDDDDLTTRERAFTLAALLRKPLSFLKKDPSFGRRTLEIGRRVAQIEASEYAKKIDDAAADAALARLPQDGGDSVSVDDERPLLLALASRLPDTAMRGAWVLAHLGDVRALGALLQLTRHPESEVRKNAAMLLQGYKGDDARTRLVWLLDDKDAKVRAAAFDAFSVHESDKRTIADVALRSSFEDIRVRGLEVLLKAAADAADKSEHLALLEDALEDESAKVRGEAFKTLWALQANKQVALSRALAARFADTRRRAVDELLGIADVWAEPLVLGAIADLDVSVATAAYEGLVRRRNPVDDNGKRKHDVDDAAAHVAALASSHGALRALGAKNARRCPPADVRSPLTKQLLDDVVDARTLALESLDALFPGENGPLVTGLAAKHHDLRVRAGELLALRKDDALLDAMKTILANREELLRFYKPEQATQLRRRAAAAIATLGKPSTVKFLATELLKDDEPGVREEAARGLATACRRGDEGYLLDAVGHADVWVRSWAGEGLARLGDARCLPVLVGTLRHEHLPIRRGAVLSFAAFGAEGFSGLLQGLDDDSRELEELVFSIILAHDLALARRGEAPTLLAASLSAARPEVRYAAARALELRADLAAYTAHLVEVLSPEKPEKAADLKAWPEVLRDDDKRAALMVQLAEALSAALPEQRYAAASALLHKQNPKAYAVAVADAVKLRSTTTPWTPDNRPRPADEGAAAGSRVKGFLRRVFAGSSSSPSTSTSEPHKPVSEAEKQRLRLLAFGAYVGLLRQQVSGDDGQRVRRDAVDRIVELGSKPTPQGVSKDAALPALTRALDDGQHLVRKAALAGLKQLFTATGGSVDDALALALRVPAGDIAKAALDELAERGQTSRVEAALGSPVAEVRKQAFEVLEKRAAKGSIAHLVLALRGEHDDLRLSVVEQLAKRKDERSVGDALAAALDSEHKGLVLRAGEILAEREDDRCVDALATLAKSEEAAHARRAREALALLGTKSAAAALLVLVDEPGIKGLAEIASCLGKTKRKETLDALARLTDRSEGDDAAAVRSAAFDAGIAVIGKTKKKRDDALAADFLPRAAKSKDLEIKKRALAELATSGKGSGADDVVVGLFGDRDVEVRQAAVAAYAERAKKLSSPTGPLEDVVKKGARELVLAAAEGLAQASGHSAASTALVPLLLVSRAAEDSEERGRALVAVGRLGDARALPELELIADGGTEEAPADAIMQRAALEGLGRLHNSLADVAARTRVWERVEAAAFDDDSDRVWRAVRALRAIGDERAKGLLVRVLDKEYLDDEVFKEVAEAVAALDVKDAEAGLAERFDEWDETLRSAARKALDKLFPNDRTRVELHVLDKSTEDDEQKAAANYLAKEGDAAVLLPRLATLDDDDLRARLRVGLVKRATLPLPPLTALLAHPKHDVVKEGAAVIVGRTWSPGETKTLVEGLLSADDRLAADSDADDAAVAVVDALVHVDVAAAAARARARLSAAPRTSARRAALGVLGRAASPADVPLLVTALGDADIGCREAAARALAVCAGKDAWNKAKDVAAKDPLRFTAVMPQTADLLKDAGARPAILPAFIHNKPHTLADAVDDKGLRPVVIDALARIDNDDVREKLSELARDAGLDEATRKRAYRALRRSMRRGDQHERQKKTKDALPSWSGAVHHAGQSAEDGAE
jgi:ParB family chromosome partitioning protein